MREPEIGMRVRFAGDAEPSEIDMRTGTITEPPDGPSMWTWVRWDSLPGTPLAHRAEDLREIMAASQYAGTADFAPAYGCLRPDLATAAARAQSLRCQDDGHDGYWGWHEERAMAGLRLRTRD